MTYIMSCVWLDYMVKYFQCKNCVGSSPKTKKCVASFQSPETTSDNPNQIFRVRDWFGLFVFFEKFAHTRFRNDADKRTKSEMRVVWTNSEIPKIKK